MITKLTAHLLSGHEYKLVDKEGNEYKIYKIQEDGDNVVSLRVTCEGKSKLMYLDQIGQDFFVLCRPLTDLTKEVNGVVPLFEIAKTSMPDEEWSLEDIEHGYISSPSNDFHFINPDFELHNAWGESIGVSNQELLFNKLYSLHFKPSSLSDECCRFIKE